MPEQTRLNPVAGLLPALLQGLEVTGQDPFVLGIDRRYTHHSKDSLPVAVARKQQSELLGVDPIGLDLAAPSIHPRNSPSGSLSVPIRPLIM